MCVCVCVCVFCFTCMNACMLVCILCKRDFNVGGVILSHSVEVR